MNIKQLAKMGLFTLNRNPLSKHLLKQNLKSRSKLQVTDIFELSKKISMFSPFTSEIHQPNDWYGHASNLKKFLDLSPEYQFKFILEHGLYLNQQVDEIDLEADLPSILTYSTYRQNILKKYRPHIFSIGPFIHYAKANLTEKEIKLEKRRLGKSVLFFPAHSTAIINFDYDIKKLCKKIKEISAGYDSVRICLYWKDILLGRHKIYQESGFECVSAGHMLDPLFLPRLKSLIEISDLTASNLISSHVGFCIYLGKPHIVLSKKMKMKQTSTEWRRRINEGFESAGYIELLNEFTKLNYKISPKQKELIKKYWGVDNIKSKSELMKIINLTEKIYSKPSN